LEQQEMKEMDFTIGDIKEIMETFHRQNLGSLKLSQGDFCLKLEGCKTEQVVAAAAAQPAPPAFSEAEESAPQYTGNVVASPIVGTFYAAPAPDKEPFVGVGQQVQKGDVLFIIESMKLMNEVTSEFSGAVTKILVENGQGVEYGQPILCIE